MPAGETQRGHSPGRRHWGPTDGWKRAGHVAVIALRESVTHTPRPFPSETGLGRSAEVPKGRARFHLLGGPARMRERAGVSLRRQSIAPDLARRGVWRGCRDTQKPPPASTRPIDPTSDARGVPPGTDPDALPWCLACDGPSRGTSPALSLASASPRPIRRSMTDRDLVVGRPLKQRAPYLVVSFPPFRSRTTGQMGDWSLSHSTGRRRCPGSSDRSPSGCPDLVANDLRQTNGTSTQAAGLWRSANGTGPSAVGGGWPAVGSRETALNRIHTSLLPLPRVACEAGMRPLPSSVASG